MNTFLKTSLAVVALASLAACSHGIQIAEHADDYNDTVEQVENKMLLKNVIRASKRMPLHFTRISDFSGSLKSTLTSGDLTIPTIGVDGGTVSYTATPSVSTESNPSYNLQVLASDTFFRGVMTPVDIETMRFFVDQGWPVPVLMFMFVEGIDVTYENKVRKGGKTVTETVKLCEIDNYPLNRNRWREFEAAIRVVEDRGTFRNESNKSDFGPVYAGSNITIEDLVRIKDAGLKLNELNPAPDGRTKTLGRQSFQISRGATSKVLEIDSEQFTTKLLDFVRERSEQQNKGYCFKESTKFLLEKSPKLPILTIDGEQKNLAELNTGQKTKMHAELRLRPALNMIYFLGELLRYQRVKGTPKTSETLNYEDDPAQTQELVHPEVLFDARRGEVEAPAISATVKGDRYSVPAYPNGGRTTQMLTLVRQILALNISSEEFPTSQTVEIVAR